MNLWCLLCTKVVYSFIPPRQPRGLCVFCVCHHCLQWCCARWRPCSSSGRWVLAAASTTGASETPCRRRYGDTDRITIVTTPCNRVIHMHTGARALCAWSEMCGVRSQYYVKGSFVWQAHGPPLRSAAANRHGLCAHQHQ
jgi:hypothetical protein